MLTYSSLAAKWLLCIITTDKRAHELYPVVPGWQLPSLQLHTYVGPKDLKQRLLKGLLVYFVLLYLSLVASPRSFGNITPHRLPLPLLNYSAHTFSNPSVAVPPGFQCGHLTLFLHQSLLRFPCLIKR